MKIHHSNKSPLKVVLMENIHQSAIDFLRKYGYDDITIFNEALQDDDLISAIRDCHLLGIRSRTQLTKKVIEQARELMVVGCFCIGTNQIDLRECLLNGVPVFNAPHSNTRSVAELVLGLTIMLLRDIFPKCLAAHHGKWLKSASGCHEVRGKKLGIIGYGHIGSQVSILAESLGMHVYFYDIETKLPLGNARPVKSLEELISFVDVITLHVPDTPLTKMMFDKSTFKLVKKGACLINASRGSVVDSHALKHALESKQIKGAALDVFESEPVSNENEFSNPVLGLNQVILTPHIGGATEEAQWNIGTEVAQKMEEYVKLGNTMGSVNFPQVSLPPHSGTHRIIHTHDNKPGMLKQINQIIADENINVTSQYLLTNEDIGYVVFDVENGVSETLIKKLENIVGTICLRILY